jgi:hypothetical protein
LPTTGVRTSAPRPVTWNKHACFRIQNSNSDSDSDWNGAERKKIYVTLKPFRVDYFTPQTIKSDFLSPKLSKTGQITSSSGFQRWLCLFLILLIFAESLKNHSKSQKNYKMENLILLDSTWVDLYNEHIIWSALVQNFCCSFRSMLFCN